MNREIKFRAWDKVTEAMCNVWDIGFKGWHDGEINYVRIETDGTVDRFDNEVELMQYTGLKDKNGKEIYEGDILNSNLCRGLRIVDFSNGSFTVYLTDNNDHHDSDRLTHAISDYSIIVGNIYENPELL